MFKDPVANLFFAQLAQRQPDRCAGPAAGPRSADRRAVSSTPSPHARRRRSTTPWSVMAVVRATASCRGAIPLWVRALRRAARRERVKETRSGSSPASPAAVGIKGAHGVVQAQVAVGLLADAVGGLRAEHDLRAALVGLELVEDGFHLPALGVEGGEVLGRGGGRIQDGDWLPRGSGPAVARPSSRACRLDRGARGARSVGVSRTPAAQRSPSRLRRGHHGRLIP